MNGLRPSGNDHTAECRMNKLLGLMAALLILFGPIAGAQLGIPPGIFPLLGVACGLVAIVRGARPLPAPGGDGTASAGAQADAQILANTNLHGSRRRGIGITDI